MMVNHFQATEYFSQQTSYESAFLTVYSGSGEPVSYDLSAFPNNEIKFGRDSGNDIVLNAGFVSRWHGMIKRLPNGNYIMEDCGSANGLLLNGQRITSHNLNEGDAIKIDKLNASRTDSVLLAFSKIGHSDGIQWRTFLISPATTQIKIGRDEKCDIHLQHISVSKIHAHITIRNGHYFLSDNNSANGIIVNGKRINRPYQLQEKDMIVITNSRLIFSQTQISYCVQKRGIGLDATGIVKKVGKHGKVICNNVSLNISPCELVAIVGGSGAGKSTVMNCLSGYSPPTDGNVNINGVSLYENYSALKNIIGYVPQSDIVYDNLSLVDMLKYAAKLRLPGDITDAELTERTEKVINTVELTDHKYTLIKKLSGGQRKRASIAVELLSDPNLFFLDEPMSGLDPGTERNLLHTLKNMTSDGKTVVFVTHSTLNLHLCDKVVFMGSGGNLCFYGSADEAQKFFGVSDVVDIYNKISAEPERWRDLYARTQKSQPTPHTGVASKPIHRKFMKQTAVLFCRNFHIMINDRIRMLLLLLQAPLLGFLISIVANGYQYYAFNITQSLLFALACSAFWVGTLNSIQEICKERNILDRERMAGLRVDSYVVSKILVFTIVCLVQAVGLTGVFAWQVGLPDVGVFGGSAFNEILLATFLSALAACGMGILVSSFFTNADRAMTVAPLLLMPQILFSGIIFELEGAASRISIGTVSRWLVQSYGTTVNLNTLDIITAQGMRMAREDSPIFEFTRANIGIAWVAMIIITVLTVWAAILVLGRAKKS